jgi:hypothetical protein
MAGEAATSNINEINALLGVSRVANLAIQHSMEIRAAAIITGP